MRYQLSCRLESRLSQRVYYHASYKHRKHRRYRKDCKVIAVSVEFALEQLLPQVVAHVYIVVYQIDAERGARGCRYCAAAAHIEILECAEERYRAYQTYASRKNPKVLVGKHVGNRHDGKRNNKDGYHYSIAIKPH